MWLIGDPEEQGPDVAFKKVLRDFFFNCATVLAYHFRKTGFHFRRHFESDV